MRNRNMETYKAEKGHIWCLGIDRRLLAEYIQIIIIIIIIIN